MAIEEEFSIEIPDKEADAIHSGMLTSSLLASRSILTYCSRTGSDIYLRSAGCPLDDGTLGEDGVGALEIEMGIVHLAADSSALR